MSVFRGMDDTLKVLRLINQGTTLAATGSSSAGDAYDAREGLLIIDINVGTDVPTSVTLQTSDDNSTFADVGTTISNASLAADGIDVYNVANLKRYNKISWTRAAANADTTWAVYLIVGSARSAPLDATTG